MIVNGNPTLFGIDWAALMNIIAVWVCVVLIFPVTLRSQPTAIGVFAVLQLSTSVWTSVVAHIIGETIFPSETISFASISLLEEISQLISIAVMAPFTTRSQPTSIWVAVLQLSTSVWTSVLAHTISAVIVLSTKQL